MRLRFWRKPPPPEENPELLQAVRELTQTARGYEQVRNDPRWRSLDPVDLDRIRALGIEIDVQRRRS